MTLREALTAAGSGDTIEFAAGLAGGTITLSQGVINITTNVTINGDVTGADGAADITIDGSGNPNSVGMFSVANGGTLNLESLTITGGGGQNGGAVFVAQGGVLSVDRSTFSGNGDAFTQTGGAIYNNGTLTITDSTFSGNSSTYVAGAVYHQIGSMTATNTTFVNNSAGNAGEIDVRGGAIYSTGTPTTTLTLINSTVTGNSVTALFNQAEGGGVSIGNGTAQFTNTIISGNTGDPFPNVGGTFTDNGGNVIDVDPTLIFGSNVLGDNGGPVQTIALVNDPSNPALDVGGRSGPGANDVAQTDITGAGNDGSDFGDAGAFELLCFAAGTLIATPDGKVAIETLSPGDLVRTQDGRNVPVLWLGVQTIDAAQARDPRHAPVQIARRAFGSHPTRDLVVTADHAIALDGSLYNASALVGLRGVTWVRVQSRVFYHVECEAHEILLANGTPSESFCDVAGRASFENHAQVRDRVIPEMPLRRITTQRLLPRHLRAHLYHAGATPRLRAA